MSGRCRGIFPGAGGGGRTLVPGPLADIERVVKVLTSRMPRPTQSTSYRTQSKSRAAGQRHTDSYGANDSGKGFRPT